MISKSCGPRPGRGSAGKPRLCSSDPCAPSMVPRSWSCMDYFFLRPANFLYICGGNLTHAKYGKALTYRLHTILTLVMPSERLTTADYFLYHGKLRMPKDETAAGNGYSKCKN